MKKFISLLALATLFTMSTASAAPQDGKRPDFSQHCQGKALNSKITLKNDGHPMTGTCQLGFKPTNPASLERGAMRNAAVQNACKGKAKGNAVNVKLEGKTIAGKCDVVFRPEMKRN